MPRKRFAQPMLSIHQRDFDPGDRSTPAKLGLIFGELSQIKALEKLLSPVE